MDKSASQIDVDIFKEERVFNQFSQMRQQNSLCDVTLKTGDTCIAAHRIILAANIPYFNNIFIAKPDPEVTKEITMYDVKPSILESIIDFAYSGTIAITEANARDLMKTANVLGITNSTQGILSASNVFDYRQLAEIISSEFLLKTTEQFIRQHLIDDDTFKTSLAVRELSIAAFLSIIQTDEPAALTVEHLFDAAICWIKHDEKHRMDLIAPILQKIRISKASPRFLVDRVCTEGIVADSPPCRPLIEDAMAFQLNILIDHTNLSLNNSIVEETKPIDAPNKNEEDENDPLIYVVINETGLVQVFDPARNTLQCSGVGLKWGFDHISQYDNKLYAFCASINKRVDIFDPKTRLWTIERRNSAQICTSAASIDRHILKQGYYTCSNSVYCFSPKDTTFISANIPSMLKCRTDQTLVMIDDFIYAIGGEVDGKPSATVEKFDINTNVWTEVNRMNHRRYLCSAAALHGRLYVCGGRAEAGIRNEAEVFDVKQQKWSRIAPMKVRRHCFALVADTGKLWAMGGIGDDQQDLFSVEIYYPELDVWEMAQNLMYGGEMMAFVLSKA